MVPIVSMSPGCLEGWTKIADLVSILFDQNIKLSVGGSIFTVSKEEILASGSPVLVDVINAGPCNGEYFLDRDGNHYRFILDYIRHGESALVSTTSAGQRKFRSSKSVRRSLLLEAKKLGLSDMLRLLEDLKTSTPSNSASGRYARFWIESQGSGTCLEGKATWSESDASVAVDREGKDFKAWAKCVDCCRPIAYTILASA